MGMEKVGRRWGVKGGRGSEVGGKEGEEGEGGGSIVSSSFSFVLFVAQGHAELIVFWGFLLLVPGRVYVRR